MGGNVVLLAVLGLGGGSLDCVLPHNRISARRQAQAQESYMARRVLGVPPAAVPVPLAAAGDIRPGVPGLGSAASSELLVFGLTTQFLRGEYEPVPVPVPVPVKEPLPGDPPPPDADAATITL